MLLLKDINTVHKSKFIVDRVRFSDESMICKKKRHAVLEHAALGRHKVQIGRKQGARMMQTSRANAPVYGSADLFFMQEKNQKVVILA